MRGGGVLSGGGAGAVAVDRDAARRKREAMADARERLLNVVFPNRGAVANAAAAIRENEAAARARLDADRAVALASDRWGDPALVRQSKG